MKVGRKRSFDTSEALDKAMRLFWENGYSATSVKDLTDVLGINKPSLYAAFGNKEALFEKALEHYVSRYAAPKLEQLTQSTHHPLPQRISNHINSIIDSVCDTTTPLGCLIVKSSCESGGTGLPEEIGQSLQTIGQVTQRTLTMLFEQAQQNGQFSADANPKASADYLMSLLYGISVLARQGRSREELRAIVNLAVAALPLKDGETVSSEWIS
ncbi:MAG: TetR/AcrR family transcriptional regulator [Candidatus Thiodiazotropha sp. (ex Ctena orbiculata)]|nr:TetR/AcrR family transcriptional regulator [Candidatus Thiodiazotropha taylori]